ncbi:hypothetical protein F511_38374 [Dorcoceras hygrometricum]|uniref:Uncharacterized protein n=1 Tax=Dorcoceras hygrometricum TaxID=472368 RepID=A0A2Z7C6C1_9LAMI|nr:hypothetical protein F511_38374 [Dorcoceras hygrometricum]
MKIGTSHYLPTEENFKEFICFLAEHHIDLADVARCATDDDLPPITRPESPPRTYSSLKTSQGNNPMYNSARGMSCKWSTGAGPRIGCVREYPSELQTRALEQVNLSPRVPFGPINIYGPIPSPRPSPKGWQRGGAGSVLSIPSPPPNDSGIPIPIPAGIGLGTGIPIPASNIK